MYMNETKVLFFWLSRSPPLEKSIYGEEDKGSPIMRKNWLILRGCV